LAYAVSPCTPYHWSEVETLFDRLVIPQELVNPSLDPDKEKLWAILYNAYGECASEILERDNQNKKGTKAWENLMEDLEPQTLRRIIDIQTAANRLQVTSDRSKDEAVFQEVQRLNKQIMSLEVTHEQLCICNLMWAFSTKRMPRNTAQFWNLARMSIWLMSSRSAKGRWTS